MAEDPFENMTTVVATYCVLCTRAVYDAICTHILQSMVDPWQCSEASLPAGSRQGPQGARRSAPNPGIGARERRLRVKPSYPPEQQENISSDERCFVHISEVVVVARSGI